MQKMIHTIARGRLRGAAVLVTLSLAAACSKEQTGAPPSEEPSSPPQPELRLPQLTVEGECGLEPGDENWFMALGLDVCDWAMGADAVVWGYVQSARLVDDVVQGNSRWDHAMVSAEECLEIPRAQIKRALEIELAPFEVLHGNVETVADGILRVRIGGSIVEYWGMSSVNSPSTLGELGIENWGEGARMGAAIHLIDGYWTIGREVPFELVDGAVAFQSGEYCTDRRAHDLSGQDLDAVRSLVNACDPSEVRDERWDVARRWVVERQPSHGYAAFCSAPTLNGPPSNAPCDEDEDCRYGDQSGVCEEGYCSW